MNYVQKIDSASMRRIQNFGTQHPLWGEYQKEKRRMIKALGRGAWEKAVSNIQ